MDRLVWAALACTAIALAQPGETAADLAARYLPELIRLDTTNPPGNETRVARYLKQVADREGIPAELLGDDPERLNFVARLRGTGKQRPLLLIAHSDVVPADRSQWSVDPLAAIEKNGYIYGRGAEDDKQLLAAELAVMVDLQRRKVVLDRDIILLSESDEEAGSLGATWIVQHAWAKIDAEFALNEYSYILPTPSGVPVFQIQTAEKVPTRFKMTAHGTAGHGSLPRDDGRGGEAMTHRILLFLAAVAAAAQVPGPRTLRLDYVHTGMAAEEHFALDGVVLEGDWPGPLDRWTDESNLGKYYFQVLDRATNRVIYSRGFASIYGEWETTGEAKQQRRAFSESVRFPAPALPVQVVIKKRGPRNEFREVWSIVVDPSDAGVQRGAPPKLNVWAVMQNGAPRDKVDLLLMGDGYTATEMEKWHRDARRMVETLFAASPFKEHRQDFNVWAVDAPAEESGVARPSDGIFRRSPLRAAYDAFGSERYVLTFDNKRLREAASAAPYEFIEIVVNDRKYGGGGIFNLFATVSADNAFTPYVFVHEFGHHFAGLADEYYTSDVAYGSATEHPEPWEPNATADPGAAKWKNLLTAGIDLPSIWPKKEFEQMEQAIQERRRAIRAQHRPEADIEALFREEGGMATRILGSGPNAGKVGAFEGAMYEGRGYYRPQQDCIMFTHPFHFISESSPTLPPPSSHQLASPRPLPKPTIPALLLANQADNSTWPLPHR